MSRRTLALKWVLCAAFLSAILLSPHLWTTERAFPTVRIVDALPDLPQFVSVTLTLLLGLSVVAVALLPRPGRFALVPPVLAAVLVIFDVNRLQPWLYQYALMFGALSLVNDARMRTQDGAGRQPGQRPGPRTAERSELALAVCAFIVSATYVWSGIQKANLTFATEVFPWLLTPLGELWTNRLHGFWFVVPVVETSIGVALLCWRTRVAGLAGLFALHAGILLAIGPLGQRANAIVWPWNVALPVMAFILCWRNDRSILRDTWALPYGKVVVILLGVMPALSFPGWWDGPLSASLYSGRLPDAWIYMTEQGVHRLPAAYRDGNPALALDAPGRYRLDLSSWADTVLSVPPYAEPRVYRSVFQALIASGVPPDQMTLLVRDPVTITSRTRTYSSLSRDDRSPWGGTGAEAGTRQQPIRVGVTHDVPRRVKTVAPAYPVEATAGRVQGTVIVEIRIGIDGAVDAARVIRSIPLLDQAALDAVRQWRYEPPTFNGVPSPLVISVAVSVSPPGAH